MRVRISASIRRHSSAVSVSCPYRLGGYTPPGRGRRVRRPVPVFLSLLRSVVSEYGSFRFFIIIISFGYNTCSLRGYRAARPERVHRPGGCGRVVTSSISFVSVQARKLFIPLRLLSPQNLRLCGDPFFRRGVLARSYPVRTVIQFFFLGGSFPFRANRKSRFTRAPCRKDRDTLSKQEVM